MVYMFSTPKPVSELLDSEEGSMWDLWTLDWIQQRAECLRFCMGRSVTPAGQLPVSTDIEYEFDTRNPYNFLQVTYYKVNCSIVHLERPTHNKPGDLFIRYYYTVFVLFNFKWSSRARLLNIYAVINLNRGHTFCSNLPVCPHTSLNLLSLNISWKSCRRRHQRLIPTLWPTPVTWRWETTLRSTGGWKAWLRRLSMTERLRMRNTGWGGESDGFALCNFFCCPL